MYKLFSILFAFFIPFLLSGQALHQWAGEGIVDKEPFELKIILLKNKHFIALVETKEAPLAIEGTWDAQDEQTFNLTVTTDKIMELGEVPIREGKLYVMDENTAIVVASGLGIELKRVKVTGQGGDAVKEVQSPTEATEVHGS